MWAGKFSSRWAGKPRHCFLPDELVNQSDPEISSNKNEIQCAKKYVIQVDQKDKTHKYGEKLEICEVQGVQEENKESMIQSEPSVQGVQEVKKISERETQGEQDVGGIQGVQFDRKKLQCEHSNSKPDTQPSQHQSDLQGDHVKLKYLVCYASNTSWFPEPAGGALRYPGVQSHGGTTNQPPPPALPPPPPPTILLRMKRT